MPPRGPEATFIVRCPDEATAAALRGSIEVEARGAAGGTTVRLHDAPAGVVGFQVHIRADAFGNLRAAARSCLNWLQAAESALATAEADAGPSDHVRQDHNL